MDPRGASAKCVVYAAIAAAVAAAAAAQNTLGFDLAPNATYSLMVGSTQWLQSAPMQVCAYGRVFSTANNTLVVNRVDETSGIDPPPFGLYTASRVYLSPNYSSSYFQVVVYFKSYSIAGVNAAAINVLFIGDVNTTNCPQGNTNNVLATTIPAFAGNGGMADRLGVLSWQGEASQVTTTVTGLANVGNNGVDAGPIVTFNPDPTADNTSVVAWSTLDNHKIIGQRTYNETGASPMHAMGLVASVPYVPTGWNYTVVFVAGSNITGTVYQWGALMQAYYNTTRMPTPALTQLGYFTDNGAYYYEWPPHETANRPWPAEEGLVLVKQALQAQGVPVRYMQLDDWWYQGPFYFGNVKCVEVWQGDTDPSLFPHGIPSFQTALDLPLMLYTPFWCDAYNATGPDGRVFNMTESTSFPGTKVIVPAESYAFFSSVLDTGMQLANNRMIAYEIDFLGANTAGSAAMFETFDAPQTWFNGLDAAATERNVTVQFCLAYPADILMGLQLPSVSHARASTDYCIPDKNTLQVAGSSLLYGALAMAPSKDTFWTQGAQPVTKCDQNSAYGVQLHVGLDTALAALSTGPVAFSDALNMTDPALVLQTCTADGTLLQPDRPLAWVDSTIRNLTKSPSSALDVRATAVTLQVTVAGANGTNMGPSATKPSMTNTTQFSMTSYYVVAWKTNTNVTLAAADLYPALPTNAITAMHKHNWTSGASQSGCTNRAPADGCVAFFGSGEMPSIPPSMPEGQSWHLHTIVPRLFTRWHILGEISKFVSVSAQRIAAIHGDEQGLTIYIRGAVGEQVVFTVVDAVCHCVLVDSVLLDGNGVGQLSFA